MNTKICGACGNEKTLNEFHIAKHLPKGRQNRCKQCTKSADAEWYQQNKKHKRNLSKKRLKELSVQFRLWKKEQGCKTCSETEPRCLELHHLDPKKKDLNISNMTCDGFSWKRIMEEASKCVVVCSNCHKKIHAKIIQL